MLLKTFSSSCGRSGIEHLSSNRAIKTRTSIPVFANVKVRLTPTTELHPEMLMIHSLFQTYAFFFFLRKKYSSILKINILIFITSWWNAGAYKGPTRVSINFFFLPL